MQVAGRLLRYEYTGAYLTEVCEVTSLSVSCADETAVPYVSGVTYDDLGRRATVQTPAGMRTYSYLEETHRLAKDRFTSSTSGLYDRTLRYAPETDPGSGFYDPLGNVLEIEAQTTGSAVDFSASYAFDQRNRLKTWQAGDMAAAEHFKYDELGNLTGHAVGESDPANQIFGGARPHAVTERTAPGVINYDYDADGNLLSETWSGGERHYRFDALNRLTCVGPATANCNVLEVDYDSSGSRLHEIRRLMSGALYPRRYAGEYFALDGDRADFHILAFGEQIAYKRKLPVTLRTAPAWSLPGLGLEPPPLLALALVSALGLAGIGLLAVRRDWAPGLREDPALAALSLALVVVLVVPPIPARAGGGGQTIDYRRWILSDPVGSATVVLEANPEDPGNQEGRAEREVVYKPFGAIHDSAGSQGLDTEQFAGHPREAATGLHYMGARWQDSNTGTFVSVDPLVPDAGDPQSYNAYSYARNNPISLIDPTGSLPEGPWPVLNLGWYFIGFDPGFQEWGTTGQWISFDAYGGLSWYSYLNGTLIDAVASQFVAGEAHVVQAQIGSLSAGTIPSSQSTFALASSDLPSTVDPRSRAAEILDNPVASLAVGMAIGRSAERQRSEGDNNPYGAGVYSNVPVKDIRSLQQVRIGYASTAGADGLEKGKGRIGAQAIRGFAIGVMLQPFADRTSLSDSAVIAQMRAASAQAAGAPVFVGVSGGPTVLVVEQGFSPVILPQGLLR
jgi:RHS repeat-associated protein